MVDLLEKEKNGCQLASLEEMVSRSSTMKAFLKAKVHKIAKFGAVPEDTTLQHGEFSFLCVEDEGDAYDAPEHEKDHQNSAQDGENEANQAV